MNKFSSTKVMVSIDKVMPNRWNPNIQSQEMFKKEIESIKVHGLIGSIAVRRITTHTTCDYEILDGEHRWKAMKELGFTQIPVEDMGEISDSWAQYWTITFNNMKGKDDIQKRAKIFEALNSNQLSLLPMTQEQIENEKALIKFDFSIYDEEKEEKYKERQLTSLITLKVTNEEKELWIKAVSIAKKNKGIDEVKLFMEFVKQFLTIAASAKEKDDIFEL